MPPLSRRLALSMAALAWACGDAGPYGPRGAAISAAADKPAVEAADPSTAPQDTTLDVHVLGSSFEPGSEVRFLLNRAYTGKVVTNHVEYVTGSDLIANITIAADADVASYDIEVQSGKGKKGIGLELFAVQSSNGGGIVEDPVRATFSSSDPFDVTSDGLGDYVDGMDGVSAIINNSGNFILDTGDGTKVKGKVQDPARELCWRIRDRTVDEPILTDECTPLHVTTNLAPVEGSFRDLPPGQTMEVRLNFESRDDRHLRFGSGCELDGHAWVERSSERAAVTAYDEDGDTRSDHWVVEADLGRWCEVVSTKGKYPQVANLDAVGGDGDGRVVSRIRIEVRKIQP